MKIETRASVGSKNTLHVSSKDVLVHEACNNRRGDPHRQCVWRRVLSPPQLLIDCRPYGQILGLADTQCDTGDNYDVPC